MFIMSMPLTFTIGETASVRINKEPATLTWRDVEHLVINGTDVRVILGMAEDADLRHFVCGDAGRPLGSQGITVEDPTGTGVGSIVTMHNVEKPQ